MADIFVKEFGDMLLTEPLSTIDNTDSEDDWIDKNDLPSPEQLQGKIILKVNYTNK